MIWTNPRREPEPLGWIGIVRLGLVQTALGAIVVLTTSTLNRVMVVELGLMALVPGLLVGWHYAIQMLRPRWGYGSDVGGRRTPWIIGGMALLASGGILAAVATALAATSTFAGMALSVAAFTLIGIGVGAAGTNLLTLLATRVAAERRAAAAATVWMMMIAGFVVTAITVGKLLDPFSMARLVAVAACVSVVAFVIATVAVLGLEGAAARQANAGQSPSDAPSKPAFRQALREVWAEREARRFTVFVFLSMLAYAMQDLILEPFAGQVFLMTPGQSTALSGTQHGGVLAGMLLVAALGNFGGGSRVGALRGWAIFGCLASAAALALLVIGSFVGPGFPLEAVVFALGASNGAFAVAAIGSMMGLATVGTGRREGTRMGLWGAAQAIAFGAGGLIGAVAVDIARAIFGAPTLAYGSVFALEAALFVLSAVLAARVGATASDGVRIATPLGGDALLELEGSRT